jgi:hypothetical protein
MSHHSNSRSASPLYQPELSSLYQKHRSKIHEEVSRLPHSPRSKEEIEQTFESLLKSIHFFRKPDIIPYPSAHGSRPEPSAELYKALLLELEKEGRERKFLEKENESLRNRLKYVMETEKTCQRCKEYAYHVNEMQGEIDKIRTRIGILTEENDNLRKQLQRSLGMSGSQNREDGRLLQEVKEYRRAYEEISGRFEREMGMQQDRYERVLREKEEMEKRMREYSEGLGKYRSSQMELERIENERVQDKIAKLKREYNDKIRNVEKREEKDRSEGVSDVRLRQIESRLTVLQDKLAEQSAINERILHAKKGIEQETFSPMKMRDLDRENGLVDYKTVENYPKSQAKSSEKKKIKGSRSENNTEQTDRQYEESPRRSLRTNSKSSSKQQVTASPNSRASRHSEYHNPECKTCVKRHKHEWAKSPR